MKRTYENAIKILESRRRIARPQASAGAAKGASKNGTPGLKGKPSIAGMTEWLRLLGYSDEKVNSLNVIHVAGTKGKGSTCAFTRSLLRAHGMRTGFPNKIGLYTGPDLRDIRERIQLDDKPILKDDFTKNFFEVWEKLTAPNVQGTETGGNLPRFLQLMTLVAIHTFIKENVEVAIIETHHGGEYDSTNVVQKPVVTGITSIGMDHIAQLGPTSQDIAWHKAGIFKKGALAFSAPQDSGPAAVLRSRAHDKGVNLIFSRIDDSLPIDRPWMRVSVQRINCSLALDIARGFLRQAKGETGQCLSEEDIRRGIHAFSWPGRFETIVEGDNEWFLDGAHNEMSIKQAADWFSSNISERTNPSILIFSHLSTERDGNALVEALATSLLEQQLRPDVIIFTSYDEKPGQCRLAGSPFISFDTALKNYTEIWRRIYPNTVISGQPTIEEALDHARKIGVSSGMRALVTGSLHLVGGALNLLQPYE